MLVLGRALLLVMVLRCGGSSLMNAINSGDDDAARTTTGTPPQTAAAATTAAPGGSDDDAAFAGRSKCPLGTVAHRGGCAVCRSGRFSASGDGRCSACPAGRFGLGGSGGRRCSGACPAGRYGVGGSVDADCSGPCPPGRWGRASSRSSSCSAPCPAGRYGVGGSRGPGCDGACPMGRFSLSGSATCTPAGRDANTAPAAVLTTAMAAATAAAGASAAAAPATARSPAYPPSSSVQVAVQLGGVALGGLLQGAESAGACRSTLCRALREGLAGSVALAPASVSLLRASAAGGPASPGPASPGAGSRGAGVVVDVNFRVPARLAPSISAELQSAQYPRLLSHYLQSAGFGQASGRIPHVGAPQLRTGQLRTGQHSSAGGAPSYPRFPAQQSQQPQRLQRQAARLPAGAVPGASKGAAPAQLPTPLLALTFCALLLVATRVSGGAAPAAPHSAAAEGVQAAALFPHSLPPLPPPPPPSPPGMLHSFGAGYGHAYQHGQPQPLQHFAPAGWDYEGTPLPACEAPMTAPGPGVGGHGAPPRVWVAGAPQPLDANANVL
jgi:hypothetical protein